MKSPYLEKSIEMIYRQLTGIIPENDYSLISARKNEGEKFTQTVFKTFETAKLSRIAMEQYTVNSKAHGVVLNIYPKITYDIPIFTFQLGGQLPEKVIFVVDIIPVAQPSSWPVLTDFAAKFPYSANQRKSNASWLDELCTPHALVCQYQPLNPEVVLEALSVYLRHWKELHDAAVENIEDEVKSKAMTSGILRFKKILQANDAGLEIYQRKFGRQMALAIEEAAFGAFPAPEQENNAEPPQPEPEEITAPSGFIWTNEAEAYLLEAPIFVRGKIRRNAELKAKEAGIQQITREFLTEIGR